jgi:hypothetical protein
MITKNNNKDKTMNYYIIQFNERIYENNRKPGL